MVQTWKKITDFLEGNENSEEFAELMSEG